MCYYETEHYPRQLMTRLDCELNSINEQLFFIR